MKRITQRHGLTALLAASFITLSSISTIAMALPAGSEISQAATAWTPATTVPATQAERLAEVAKITAKSTLSDEEKRLLLFLKFTNFASKDDRTLAELEALTKEITAWTKAHKKDYEAMALLGSATSLQSIFYFDNVGKMSFLSKKGGRILDRMVRKAPDNMGVRLQRGISYSAMPAFLDKARTAVEDFTQIKTTMQDNAAPEFVAMIDYYLALSLEKANKQKEADVLIDSLLKLNDSPWALKAAELQKSRG